MLAAYLKTHGGPEVLEVGELPTPEPGPNDVRVRLKASALNHLDIWVRKGIPGLRLQYPHILGGDGAGIVDKLGPGVQGIKTGDEVVVHPGLACGHCDKCDTGWESLCSSYQILGEHLSGTNAEYVIVPAENVFPKPASLSFENAAAVPLVFTTAWQMVVRRAKVQPGHTVLIHAAGSGVSSAAIQIAKVLGATVIATAGSDEKCEAAKKLGANHVVNYRTGDFLAECKQMNRNGVDAVIDHVGPDVWEKSLKALRSGGRLVTCGSSSGPIAPTDLRHVFFRQLEILGSTMGSKKDFPIILRELGSGRMVPVVDRVLPLSDVQKAHALLENRDQFGKVILSL